MQGTIQTVTGLKKSWETGNVDGHTHLWLHDAKGFLKENKEIDDYISIKNELIDFKQYGGSACIDCTPWGCGRSGIILKRLSQESGINIIAVTGFHKKQNYITGSGPWLLDIGEAEDLFISEIRDCLTECRDIDNKIRAGAIKIPYIGKPEGEYLTLTLAAINASVNTDIPIIVHTEKGLGVEDFADFLESHGIGPNRVMICHMDKRDEFDLHRELACRGFYLEYDTFLRKKYNPEKRLLPLLKKMVIEGFEESIIFGSDICNNLMWRDIAGKEGLNGVFSNFIKKIASQGIEHRAIEKILGKNSTAFLSFNSKG